MENEANPKARPGTAGTGRKPSTAAASGERQSRRQAVAVAKVIKAANSNRRAPHASDTPVPSPHAAAWEGGHHRSGPLPRRAGKGPGPAIGDLSKALPRRAAGGHAFAIGFDTPNDAWGEGGCATQGGGSNRHGLFWTRACHPCAEALPLYRSKYNG